MKTLIIQQANYCLTALRCAVAAGRGRETGTGMLVLPPGGLGHRQAGLSKIALTLIILGVSVGITVIVFGILREPIIDLARGIADAIRGVNPSGSSWGE